MAVDHDPRIRLLLPENEIQRLPHRLQIFGGQPLVAVGRHEACRDVQRVPLLERQIERTAEQLHHLAARLRPAGFQKTKMPGGHIGVGRQFDLGQPAHTSPMLQQAAEMPSRHMLRVVVWRIHAGNLDHRFRRAITSDVSDDPTIPCKGCRMRNAR